MGRDAPPLTEHDRRSGWAIIATFIVLAVNAALFLALPRRALVRPPDTLPSVWEFANSVVPLADTRHQRLTHLGIVATTAAAAVLLYALRRRRVLVAPRDRAWSRLCAWAGRYGWIAIAAIATLHGAGEGGWAGLLAGIAACLLAGAILRAAGARPSGALKVFAWLLAGGAVAVQLAALSWPVVLAPGGQLWVSQQHHTFFSGSALRLALGGRWFEDVPPAYGVLLQSLAGVALRHAVHATFGDLLRFIQVLQVLSGIAGFAGCILLSRSARPSRILLPALLFFAVSNSMDVNALLFPNHSAWRHLGILLSPLVFACLAGARDSIFAGALGAYTVLAVLTNLETGLTVAAGCGVFLLTGTQRRGTARRPRLVLAALAGCAAALAAFSLLLGAGLGDWGALGRVRAGFLPALTGFNLGAGERFRGDPMALLILGTTVWQILRGSLALAVRPLTRRQAALVSLAVINLLWLAYYANRSAPEYLAVNVFLWIPLFAGFLNLDLWRRLVARRSSMPLVAASTIFVVVPYLAARLSFLVPAYRWGFSGAPLPPPSRAAEVSGVVVPGECALEVRRKSDRVRELSTRGRVCYATSMPILVPLISRSGNGLPSDSLASVLTFEGLNAMRERLLSCDADYLLVDDYTTPCHRDEVPAVEDVMLKNLGALAWERYGAPRRSDGWLVFRRPSGGEGSP